MPLKSLVPFIERLPLGKVLHENSFLVSRAHFDMNDSLHSRRPSGFDKIV